MITILAFSLAALAPQAVDQMKIDEAISRGLQALRKAKSPAVGFAKIEDSDELILLTFIHGGVAPDDPKFKSLLEHVLARKLERTYESALQAMIFEELDRVKYQGRILQCAQHLADNQGANGQWSYGQSTPFMPEVPPAPKDTASGGSKPKPGALVDFSAPDAKREKPRVTRKLAVKKSRDGPAKGDNSNSQYAALGLRACFDAGILFEKDLLNRARAWWVESQHPADSKEGGAVATGTGLAAPPRGWCYSRTDVCAKAHRPYAGMTAGAAGAVVIYDYMMQADWKRDPVVASGMAWLAARFSVTENAGPNEIVGKPTTELYYALYALERLGMLYDTPKIGSHDWYAEGAAAILKAQKADGTWDDGTDRGTSVWDTCFAILFLKKATRALEDVATTERRR